MNIDNFKKAGSFIGMSLFHRIIGYAVFRLAALNVSTSSNLQLVGDVANYSAWLKLKFTNPRIFFNREKLFLFLLKNELSYNTIVFEFGVAKGYLTQWVLGKDLNRKIAYWNGFDTFEGLPQSWRNYESGAFSNNGEAPSIDDPRITWHVGFAEEQIQKIQLSNVRNRPLMIIFDLDLEEPTKIIMKHLTPWLKIGDLIYFDEAFDAGERRVIVEHVIPNFDVEVIGATPLAVIFRIVGIAC